MVFILQSLPMYTKQNKWCKFGFNLARLNFKSQDDYETLMSKLLVEFLCEPGRHCIIN